MEQTTVTLVRIVLGKEREGAEVSNRDGSLTPALIERERERRRWWRPWIRIELDGYEDPFEGNL